MKRTGGRRNNMRGWDKNSGGLRQFQHRMPCIRKGTLLTLSVDAAFVTAKAFVPKASLKPTIVSLNHEKGSDSVVEA